MTYRKENAAMWGKNKFVCVRSNYAMPAGKCRWIKQGHFLAKVTPWPANNAVPYFSAAHPRHAHPALHTRRAWCYRLLELAAQLSATSSKACSKRAVAGVMLRPLAKV